MRQPVRKIAAVLAAPLLLGALSGTAAATPTTTSAASPPNVNISLDRPVLFRPGSVTARRTPAGATCTAANASLTLTNKTRRGQVVTQHGKAVARVPALQKVSLCLYVDGGDTGGATFHLRENPAANLFVVVT